MSSVFTSPEARSNQPQIPHDDCREASPSRDVPAGDMGDRPISEAGPRAPHLTDTAIAEKRRRLGLVQCYQSFISTMPSRAAAAAAMRRAGYTESRSNLDRYLIAYLGGGEEALTPNWRNCGREPKCALTEHEALILKGLIMAKSTQEALHVALAIELFRFHEACLPTTRIFIEQELDRAAQRRRLPTWPPSWRRAAYPTKQELAKFHGTKQSMVVEHMDRRSMTIVEVGDVVVPMQPHSIWEMDDASDNAPRISIDPATGKTSLNRQTLWTQDVFSGAMLGFTDVARDGDAYRGEDVADHVANSVRSHGRPKILRLEMGKIWNGSFFHGILPDDVPGWPEDEYWGGLDPIIKIENVHNSKGKGAVEASFNLLQTMLAHEAMDIGRFAGDYEVASKLQTAAKRSGKIDPRFWTAAQSAEKKYEICQWFNSRPKQRHAFGKDTVAPNDLLRGAKGDQMPDDQWWRFMPVKQTATVRGGHVEISLKQYQFPFRFTVNGTTDGVHLDHGYRVLVAFHPGRPEEGCFIFNAELGARNREGYRRAEFICIAPVSVLKPQVSYSAHPSFDARKKASATVNRDYRATVGAAAPYRASHRQTGTGAILRSTSGTPTTTEPAAPADPIVPAARTRENPEASASRAMTPCSDDEFTLQRARQARRLSAMAATADA